MTKKIFVFIGKQGVGKDTAAAIVGKYFEGRNYAFADLLRQTCWNLFSHKLQYKDRLFSNFEEKNKPVPGWIIPKDTAKLLGVPEGTEWSGRRLLQWFGTEVARTGSGYDDIWIDHLLERVENSPSNIVTITDCRFPNEYAALQGIASTHNIVFVNITRDLVENSQVANHSSEKYISKLKWDYTIVNNGDLASFQTSVINLVYTYLPKKPFSPK